jgi:hypothetical protein
MVKVMWRMSCGLGMRDLAGARDWIGIRFHDVLWEMETGNSGGSQQLRINLRH